MPSRPLKYWNGCEEESRLTRSVALAYGMHIAHTSSYRGGRKVEHSEGNNEALELVLDASDMDEIEQAYPFDVGFPHDMLSGGLSAARGPEENVIWK